jgi:uncharacterized protein (DUF488 family)
MAITVERGKSARDNVGRKLIYTIGHSRHEFALFVSLLKRNDVTILLDIRRFPNSKRNPQFNKERLAEFIPREGIRYLHVEELGGRRELSQESKSNSAWRSAAFRAYADHMGSKEFLRGLKKLSALEAAERRKGGRIALMCAEALPWKCHRLILSDALTARKFRVEHILPKGKRLVHQLTPFARIDKNGGTIVHYPRMLNETD